MAARVTTKEIQYMVRLQKEGKSLRVIADMVGRDRGTVERYLCHGCLDEKLSHIVKCRRSQNLAKR